jgi:hypothetical protein
MMVIVSPLMKTVPSFRFISPSTLSSASSNTTLMCMSKALSSPTYCRWFFSSTMTLFPLALLRASNGLGSTLSPKTLVVVAYL